MFVADQLSLRLVPDELWALAEPLIPKFRPRPQGGGTAPLDDRAVFTAIVYVLTSGCAWLSWTFAAETPTASGTPWAPDSTCSLLPGLPRSTGLGPVSDPLFSPAPTRRR